MNKWLVIVLVAVVGGGLGLAWILHRQVETKFQANEALLANQKHELDQLRRTREDLSNRPSLAPQNQIEQAQGEVNRLRQQKEALQKEQQDRARLAKNSEPKRPASAAPQTPRPPEYYEKLHQRAGNKCSETLQLNLALRQFASEHGGQFPQKIEQLAPYLEAEKVSLSGTNQFEVVYQGSNDALAKVPGSAIALLRDRQTWLAPSGKSARVYGMADGSARIVESDDDFKTWEAEHLIPTPGSGSGTTSR